MGLAGRIKTDLGISGSATAGLALVAEGAVEGPADAMTAQSKAETVPSRRGREEEDFPKSRGLEIVLLLESIAQKIKDEDDSEDDFCM